MRAAALTLIVALLALPAWADDLEQRMSPGELASYYRTFAEAGQARAQSRLGVLYRVGRGVPQSDSDAFFWIRKAAVAGDSAAQHYLGLFYLSGVGTEANLDEAGVWLRRCAELDQPISLFDLAWFELADGGLPRFAEAATAIVRNGAEQGLEEAERAFQLLQREQPNPAAEASGIDWLRQSAEMGHPEAQYQLGMALNAGRGTTANAPQAALWFERAAVGGNERAMRSLGIAYLTGRGREPDDSQAYGWLWLAERHGDPIAGHDLALVGALLSTSSLEGARAKASAWEEAHGL